MQLLTHAKILFSQTVINHERIPYIPFWKRKKKARENVICKKQFSNKKCLLAELNYFQCFIQIKYGTLQE